MEPPTNEGLVTPARLIRDAAEVAAALAVAVGITSRPGFDVLDYHFALGIGPAVGLLAAVRVARAGRHACASRAVCGSLLGLVLAPLAVIAARALVVANCDVFTGAVFYVLGPACSVLTGGLMGSIAARFASGWRAGLCAVGLAVGSAVPAFWHFLTTQQVFAYHGLVGYLAGALYEDAVAPSRTWALFRLVSLAMWAALAAACHAPPGTLRRVGAVVAITAAAVGHLRGPEEGWRVDRTALLEALDHRVAIHLPSGAHDLDPALGEGAPVLVLHAPALRKRDRRLRTLAVDALYQHLRLRAFFGRSPARTVHVHLYEDREQKRRLMGALRVEMAKPWLGHVHMVMPGWGSSLLAHELAHVYAGRLSGGLFEVPMRLGLIPDALLIEGVAVAAEWPQRSGMDPHRWSAAMRKLGLAPTLDTLLSPVAFATASGARAYTIAGSFLRWLRDTRGAATLHAAYATGDIEAAAGEPLDALIAAWQRFVDDRRLHPLSHADLARAEARFERPGLFKRPCALAIGRCLHAAGLAWQRGESREAAALLAATGQRVEHAARGAPVDLRLQIARSVAEARIGEHGSADERLERILARDAVVERRGPGALSALSRAAVQRVRADLRLQAHDLEGASTGWHEAAAAPLGEGALRTLDVKRQLLDDARQAGEAVGAAPRLGALRGALAAGRPAIGGRGKLLGLRKAGLDDPVSRYLSARIRRWGRQVTREHRRLDALLPALAPWPRLARETRRMLDEWAARTGRCQALGDDAPDAAWRAEYRRRCAVHAWVERDGVWSRTRRSPGPGGATVERLTLGTRAPAVGGDEAAAP